MSPVWTCGVTVTVNDAWVPSTILGFPDMEIEYSSLSVIVPVFGPGSAIDTLPVLVVGLLSVTVNVSSFSTAASSFVSTGAFLLLSPPINARTVLVSEL